MRLSDVVPFELQMLDQWIVWNLEGSRKMPRTIEGRPASTTDPATWAAFEAALEAAPRFSGIGFVFTDADPYCGIDLDGCRDPETGAVQDWAKRWITEFNSYAEVSPSGTGVKIWCRGRWSRETGGKRPIPDAPKITDKTPEIEVYDHARYFALTGKRLRGHTEIRDAQPAIDTLFKAFFTEARQEPRRDQERSSRLSVIERARAYLDAIPGAVSGQDGHGATFRAACILICGFSLTKAEALVLLSEWNRRCEPAWSERELRHKLDDADKQPGARGYLRDSSDPSRVRVPDYEEPRRQTATVEEREPDPDPSRAPLWPVMAPEAYHGLAGDFVSLTEPHSEADPVAILLQFLAAFGSVIGRTAHYDVEADRHFGNLFLALVGVSSKGRKGVSWGHVKHLLSQVEPEWVQDRIISGASSGEGIVEQVRDPVTRMEPTQGAKSKTSEPDYQEKMVDAGISDKRLLVVESELAMPLKNIERQGNNLSALLRDCWDGKERIGFATKRGSRATGAHISIVGHITKHELLRMFDSTEAGNGFGNRFLWAMVRRSKCLPFGGTVPENELGILSHRLRRAIDHARRAGSVPMGEDAREGWIGVYPALSDPKPGLLGSMIGRAEAQTVRLALLDESPQISLPHLEAALAVWQYCEDSARMIFGDSLGDPTADDILEAIRGATPGGMTRSEIRDLFQRHKSGEEITRALQALFESGLAEFTRETTDGRPIERWTVSR